MSWLIDTNVISEVRRPRPEPRVLSFLASCHLRDLYTSPVVLAELRYGIACLRDLARQTEMKLWLETQIRPMFADRVLAIDEDTMLRWRHLVEAGRKAGHTFAQLDLILAATALEHNLTLVTRNVQDFQGTGVVLLDPWNDIP